MCAQVIGLAGDQVAHENGKKQKREQWQSHHAMSDRRQSVLRIKQDEKERYLHAKQKHGGLNGGFREFGMKRSRLAGCYKSTEARSFGIDPRRRQGCQG